MKSLLLRKKMVFTLLWMAFGILCPSPRNWRNLILIALINGFIHGRAWKLNTNTICTNKVNLYGNYMLISPQFSAKTVKFVRVQAKIVVKSTRSPNTAQAEPRPRWNCSTSKERWWLPKSTLTAKHCHNKFLKIIWQCQRAQTGSPCAYQPQGADVNSAGAVHELVRSLPASSSDGSLVVGDLNGDGVCDVTDVTALINIILEESVTADAADINGDGNIDVSDVTALINKILQ